MRDARLLLAHALDISIDRLTLVLHDQLSETQAATFHTLITKRATRQPVSQLLGRREFWGRAFRVTPDVLDPRPDTELLIETALEHPFDRVLDLGTGTGCILLSLLCEHKTATGIGTDISDAALSIASTNAIRHEVQNRVSFIRSDWYQNVTGKFDLILSNPPYITADEYKTLAPEVLDWEPKIALTPGGDGLSAYRQIIAGAALHLTPNGTLIVEIGMSQAQAVLGLFQIAGFVDCAVKSDLNNRDRVVYGRMPGTIR